MWVDYRHNFHVVDLEQHSDSPTPPPATPLQPLKTMLLPNAHNLLHGVSRDFLELVFSTKTLAEAGVELSTRVVDLMRRRIREVVLTLDFDRPVRDPTKGLGQSTAKEKLVIKTGRTFEEEQTFMTVVAPYVFAGGA